MVNMNDYLDANPRSVAEGIMGTNNIAIERRYSPKLYLVEETGPFMSRVAKKAKYVIPIGSALGVGVISGGADLIAHEAIVEKHDAKEENKFLILNLNPLNLGEYSNLIRSEDESLIVKPDEYALNLKGAKNREIKARKGRKNNYVGLQVSRSWPALEEVNQNTKMLEKETRYLIPNAEFRTWDDKFIALGGGKYGRRIAGDFFAELEALYTEGTISDGLEGTANLTGLIGIPLELPAEVSNKQSMQVGILQLNGIYNPELTKELSLILGGGANVARVKSGGEYNLSVQPISERNIRGSLTDNGVGWQAFGGLEINFPKDFALEIIGGYLGNKIEGDLNLEGNILGPDDIKLVVPLTVDLSGPFVGVSFLYKF